MNGAQGGWRRGAMRRPRSMPLAAGRWRRLPLIAAVSLLACALPASATGSAAHPTLPEIEPQAMCVTCKIPLSTAESPQAEEEREFIKEQIAAGDDEAKVKQALVAQYGPQVLSLPSTKGFDLAAYLVPLAVALALIAILATLLPRWLRANRASPVAQTQEALSKSESERLDRDMKRFD